MKSLVMVLSIIPIIAVSESRATAENVFFTYKIVDYPALESGYTLSGLITTTLENGTLTAADIVDWTWTATNSNTGFTFTQNMSDPGSLSLISGTIDITATSITIPAASPDTDNFIDLRNLFTPSDLAYERTSLNPSYSDLYLGAYLINPATIFWGDISLSPPLSLGSTDTWTVANLWAVSSEANGPVTTTPEPGSLTLLSLGLASFAGLGWLTNRKTRSIAILGSTTEVPEK